MTKLHDNKEIQDTGRVYFKACRIRFVNDEVRDRIFLPGLTAADRNL